MPESDTIRFDKIILSIVVQQTAYTENRSYDEAMKYLYILLRSSIMANLI